MHACTGMATSLARLDSCEYQQNAHWAPSRRLCAAKPRLRREGQVAEKLAGQCDGHVLARCVEAVLRDSQQRSVQRRISPDQSLRATKPCLGREGQVRGRLAGGRNDHVLARRMGAALCGGQQNNVQRRIRGDQPHGKLRVVEAGVARVKQPQRAKLGPARDAVPAALFQGNVDLNSTPLLNELLCL